MGKGREIVRSASVMSLATLISRILGFLRDMVLARYLGATGLSDTFFVAFRVPNLLRELFAEGSMSSAFVPVLSEVSAKRGEEEAGRVTSITFTFLIVFVGLVVVLGILLAPQIVALIAPGFKEPEKLSLTITLTRIMFPFLLFVSLAALCMGALNVKGVFFVPAMSSSWFNLTVIVLVITITAVTRSPLIAAATGITVGGFMQFATQVPTFLRRGYRFRLNWSFNDEALKKIGRLVLPTTVGLAVSQINIFVSTILASYLKEGSITYLYYSMRLIQFPVGIFGVAMGMAVLPTLSRHASTGQMEALKEDFSYAIRMLFFISLPSMMGLIALREPIVNLLFQRGQFDYTATQGTAFSLIFYSLGIWSIVGTRVVVAAFYSMQDTRTPVAVAALAMVLNILFSLMLMVPLGHGGLALSNSLSSWVNFSLLFYILRRKLGRLGGREILKGFLKTLLASSLMALVAWALLRGELWQESGFITKKALYLFLTIVLSALLYGGCCKIMGVEELKELFRIIKERSRG
ncbi:MAG: murein biosynthesis integral membrane protein MurJ [Nitrospirae bacterium]|nr:MAG: murein biosynthesis integral membrane protein MurJ [Nitrospirota bacterium]